GVHTVVDNRPRLIGILEARRSTAKTSRRSTAKTPRAPRKPGPLNSQERAATPRHGALPDAAQWSGLLVVFVGVLGVLAVGSFGSSDCCVGQKDSTKDQEPPSNRRESGVFWASTRVEIKATTRKENGCLCRLVALDS